MMASVSFPATGILEGYFRTIPQELIETQPAWTERGKGRGPAPNRDPVDRQGSWCGGPGGGLFAWNDFAGASSPSRGRCFPRCRSPSLDSRTHLRHWEQGLTLAGMALLILPR